GLSVEDYLQSRVEEAVVPDLVLEKLRMKLEILKNRIIRNEGHQRTIRFARLCLFVFFNQYASLELRRLLLPFPHRCNLEVIAECIHSLRTHAVQSNGFLKGLAVVFRSGVDLAHHVHNLSEGNAAAIISHSHL